MAARKVIILGAAGRDFHNFNVFFRENPQYRVVAFTATQIPGISGRRYPKELAGRRYPRGIAIHPEDELPALISRFKCDVVVLAYSDISHAELMHKASLTLSLGADFTLLGPKSTMLVSRKPVVAVTGVRTGVGKSPTTRRVAELMRGMGKRVVIVRHPMPYGHFEAMQRFARVEDLSEHSVTIEEREEYAPLIAAGHVVYSGVDYAKVLRAAEKEADVIVWDGGNNDMPFFRPDLHIVIADAKRPGHEVSYYPGEANFRAADVILISKVDSARPENVEEVSRNARSVNPKAIQIRAELRISTDEGERLKGRRVLVVEDGPTLTHGGMSTGAGTISALSHGCEIVDPHPYAVGMIRRAYEEYPHIGAALPALGYSAREVAELERTINSVPADMVVFGTPVDLREILHLNKPAVRVRYDLREVSQPGLEEIVRRWSQKV